MWLICISSVLLLIHTSQAETQTVTTKNVILRIKPKVRCNEEYKVVAYIKNATQRIRLPKDESMKFYTMKCNPSYENRFCLKDKDLGTKYWKMYQPCEWNEEDGTTLECPLYHQFKTFHDFFEWNVETSVVRVAGILGDSEVLFTTKGSVVTPLFKCDNGNTITAGNPMFKKVLAIV